MNEKIKLAVFDFDNTLVDSRKIVYFLWKKTAEFYGKSFLYSENEFNNLLLQHAWDWKQFALKEFDFWKNIHNELFELWNNISLDIYKKNVSFYDWVKELFKKIEERSIKIAIATNNHRDKVKYILEKKWIGEYRINDKNSHPQKPNPKMIIDHMDYFWFTAGNTIVIGDSSDDFIAAQKAWIEKIVLAEYGFKWDLWKIEWLYSDKIGKLPNLLKIIDSYE